MMVSNPQPSRWDEGAAESERSGRLLSRLTWRDALFFLPLFAIVVGLQVASGAYHCEFGGYPDEPAHYVTSLMVRDYIAQMHWFSPTQFAEDYYAHYPKVAMGHWPPLLYVVQGAWMLIFSPARASVLLELALLTAILAFSVYALVKARFGWAAGVAAALLLACLPEIQLYTDEIMAETLLILVSLWGAVFFARYLDSERWRDSLWFGIFSALAVMTKGNGWELAFVPPVALILTRRWRLLSRASFWLPVLVVVVTCLPWQIWSFPMAHRGWTGGDQPNVSYTLEAMGEFLKVLGGFMGPVLTAVAVVGIAVTVVVPFFRGSVEAFWAVMLALIFGVWAFHVLIPAGIESRKMIVAIPALILFLFAGTKWIADRIPVGVRLARWRPAALMALLAVVFAFQTFAIPREIHYGFTEAAAFIAAKKDPRDLVVLVSSERDGEGMLVSEVAMQEHRPTHTILRGTKALSTSDWTGGAYKSLFKSSADLQAYLVTTGVGLVVTDTYPSKIRYMHHQLLLQAIRDNPRSWQLLETFPTGKPGPSDQIQVYRFDPRAH